MYLLRDLLADSAYTTFAELFPTHLRATGIGVCVAGGRLGGMVGVVGLSYLTAGLGLVAAFVLLGIGAVAAVIWKKRGVEARGSRSKKCPRLHSSPPEQGVFVFDEPYTPVDLGVYLGQANYPPWGFK